VTEQEWDPYDVLLVIDHPFGQVETTLAEWMARGPGPRRFLRPVAAKSRFTGDDLPLTVVPLAYRNDETARALIEAGELEWPWPTPK
jgi:hypothetical protein